MLFTLYFSDFVRVHLQLNILYFFDGCSKLKVVTYKISEAYSY